jgi:hypothetical protein
VPQPASAFAEVSVLVRDNLNFCIQADETSGSAEDVFAAEVKIYLPTDHAPAEPSGFSTLYHSCTEPAPTDTDCPAAGSTRAAPLEMINQTSPPLNPKTSPLNPKTSQADFATRVSTLSYNYTTLSYNYTTLSYNYSMTMTRFCFVETPAESDAAGAAAYVTFFAWACVAVFVFVSRKGEQPPAGARAVDAAPTVKPARAKSVGGLGPVGLWVMLMLALFFLTRGAVSSAEKIGCAESDADCGQAEAAARGSTVWMTPLGGAGAAADLPRRALQAAGGGEVLAAQCWNLDTYDAVVCGGTGLQPCWDLSGEDSFDCAVFASCGVDCGATLCAGYTHSDGNPCGCAEASALIVDGHAVITGYTAINQYAFIGCALTSVEFSEGLVTIGWYAFQGTGLTSLRLPNSLMFLSQSAFSDCQQLASVHFGSGLLWVGPDALTNFASTYMPAGHCAGMYVNYTSDCIACAAGRYVDTTGSDQASDCIWCDPGRFGAGGSPTSQCTGDCAAGRYSELRYSGDAEDAVVEGTSGCIDCGADAYADAAGSATCTPCPAGTSSAADSGTSCGTCIATVGEQLWIDNATATAGVCTVCPKPSRCANSVCVGNSKGRGCTDCDAGYFSGGAKCYKCPEGGAQTIQSIVAVVATLAIVSWIWKLAEARIAESGEDSDAEDSVMDKVKEVKEAVSDKKGKVELATKATTAVATLSNTAVVSSIALPTLVQISFTISLPAFPFPDILKEFAVWIAAAFSFDMVRIDALAECSYSSIVLTPRFVRRRESSAARNVRSRLNRRSCSSPSSSLRTAPSSSFASYSPCLKRRPVSATQATRPCTRSMPGPPPTRWRCPH